MAISILDISEISINCADMACTKEFYRLVGMHQGSDVLSPVQSGDGLGLAGEVQCLSHRLRAGAGEAQTALNLLQWLQPPPWGEVPAIPHQLGYARLAFYVSDLNLLYQQLLDRQSAALSELYYDQPTGLRWCYCRDPNGCLVELVERSGSTTVGYLVLNCEDLAKSIAWYNVLFDLQPGPVQRLGVAPQLLDGRKPGQVISVQMNLPETAANRFGLVLQQWQQPEAQGQPFKKANHMGISRLVFVVADVQDAYEYLQSERIDGVFAPCQWQTGSVKDRRRSLLMYEPTGACIELREAAGS